MKAWCTRLAPLALVAIAAWSAWANHFLQDDAFITFRYAAHFAQGQGLVWYPGSDEYGFTNFLFALAIGLLMKLGFGPEIASYLISVPSYFAALGLTFLIARRTLGSWAGYVCCLMLALRPTFAAYATGGMETSLQTALVLAVYYEMLRSKTRPMGIYAALALLTRLDSALLLFPAYVACLLRRTSLRALIEASLIPILAVAALLGFCHAYYGYALPTSFYAKIDGAWHWPEAYGYLWGYVQAQNYVPLLLGVGALLLALWRHVGGWLFLWCSILLVWFIYIFYIGGDFMDFRLLVPVMPFFFLAVLATLPERLRLVSSALIIALTLYGDYSQERFKDWMPGGIAQSKSMLTFFLEGPPVGWANSGRALHELFYRATESDVKIAVGPSGAMPYYSELPAFDQFALNTRGVLTHGVHYTNYPGHRIRATVKYMWEEKVNLAIGHPLYFCKEKDTLTCAPQPVNVPERDPTLDAVLLPMGHDCYLLAYYMTHHPNIDALIKQGKILKFEKGSNVAHCPGW